jgi:hypothetical protein
LFKDEIAAMLDLRNLAVKGDDFATKGTQDITELLASSSGGFGFSSQSMQRAHGMAQVGDFIELGGRLDTAVGAVERAFERILRSGFLQSTLRAERARGSEELHNKECSTGEN